MESIPCNGWDETKLTLRMLKRTYGIKGKVDVLDFVEWAEQQYEYWLGQKQPKVVPVCCPCCQAELLYEGKKLSFPMCEEAPFRPLQALSDVEKNEYEGNEKVVKK